MNRLDPNTLFNIFEKGDEEIYKEHGIEETLDNPYVLINMVVRGLENYTIMDQMYMYQYPKQYKGSRQVVKFKYFNKLYGYLKRIDITQLQFQVGESYELLKSVKVMEDFLYYYERIEHYEKCALIVKYINLLKRTKKKVNTLI
jgi:hypothetical protein